MSKLAHSLIMASLYQYDSVTFIAKHKLLGNPWMLHKQWPPHRLHNNVIPNMERLPKLTASMFDNFDLFHPMVFGLLFNIDYFTMGTNHRVMAARLTNVPFNNICYALPNWLPKGKDNDPWIWKDTYERPCLGITDHIPRRISTSKYTCNQLRHLMVCNEPGGEYVNPNAYQNQLKAIHNYILNMNRMSRSFHLADRS